MKHTIAIISFLSVFVASFAANAQQVCLTNNTTKAVNCSQYKLGLLIKDQQNKVTAASVMLNATQCLNLDKNASYTIAINSKNSCDCQEPLFELNGVTIDLNGNIHKNLLGTSSYAVSMMCFNIDIKQPLAITVTGGTGCQNG